MNRRRSVGDRRFHHVREHDADGLAVNELDRQPQARFQESKLGPTVSDRISICS